MRKAVLCVIWFGLLLGISQAQAETGISNDNPESRTLALQNKVDRLYDRGEFKRAYFIYRNELVPLGDKYAQYMVGYMLLTGTGVDEDPIRASAWYRLAAERGTPEFVAVRDQLLHDIKDDDRRRSDHLYQELRREFSDIAVLLVSIKRDLKELQPVTGSRLSSGSDAVTIVDPRTGNSRAAAQYYGRVQRRLEERLQTLAEIGDFPDLETDPSKVDIDDVERIVRERIESNPD